VRYATRRALDLVKVMHIMALVYINDDDGGLLSVYEEWLEVLPTHPYEPALA
jgi:hypothetical protein